MVKQIKINGKILSEADLLEALENQSSPDWERQVYSFIVNWIDDSEVIVQKTSGSTGTPKEIRLKKSTMLASARKTLEYFGLTKNDTAWLCLPVAYIAGKMMVVRAVEGQLDLIISQPSSTLQLDDQFIDFTAMVPMQLQNLISSEFDFRQIKKIIVGGAAVNYGLRIEIEKLPCEVYATYGMTETSSHIAVQRLNGTQPDQYFHLLSGFSVQVDENWCLQIEAPGFFESVLQTTDVVELVSPKAFRWLGRADNVINSGGIKISPEQLEKEISAIINRENVITSIPDRLLGQKLVLVIEGSKECCNENALLAKIEKQIGKHMSPKLVYYIETLPRTSTMKVDRAQLKDVF
ncbi:MAG: AMP-binding protein [Prolixibacteraceae bacterium]|jgi:O-succinylbenzoic acid--CoA ligase|nr:AMP-binding protein [Prolixibacteraceae bacterium]